jgi:hypothetical protein
MNRRCLLLPIYSTTGMLLPHFARAASGETHSTDWLPAVQTELVVPLNLSTSVASSSCKSAGDSHGQFTRLQNFFLSSFGPVCIFASIGGEKAGGQFKRTSWDA